MKRSADEEDAEEGEIENVYGGFPKRRAMEDSEHTEHIVGESVDRSSSDAVQKTWVDRSRKSDRQIIDALKNKYDSGERSEDVQCEKIKRRYLVTYMKKVIEQLPLSREIIDASKSIDETDEFLKMYSVAKTCVHSEMQLKKMVAFNSVFDMISHVVGRGLHDRLVTPHLKNLVPSRDLDSAYDAFKEALSSDDCKTSTELHCVAYLIQNEMEKDKPLKISNPIFNRFTQQLKAASKYVTALLQSLASKPLMPHPPAADAATQFTAWKHDSRDVEESLSKEGLGTETTAKKEGSLQGETSVTEDTQGSIVSERGGVEEARENTVEGYGEKYDPVDSEGESGNEETEDETESGEN